jgi:flagellar motor switch protein FliN/FliY
MADETLPTDLGGERPSPEATPPVEPAPAALPPEPQALNIATSDELPPPAGSSNTIDQAELDALTSQALGVVGPAAEAEPVAAPEPTAGPEAGALPEAAVVGATTVSVSAAEATPFSEPELSSAGASAVTSIDLLNDVRLDVKIELGRTNMYIEDVLKLGVGSVVELDKLAGDPVDIYVSERLIARGEVLVLNDNFCVRINNIHSPIPQLEAN